MNNNTVSNTTSEQQSNSTQKTDEQLRKELQAEIDKKQKEQEASIPTEYKNALKQAESYANKMHLSKKGVYDQLTSEYGGKFTPEEAQYAIDNLGNWL